MGRPKASPYGPIGKLIRKFSNFRIGLSNINCKDPFEAGKLHGKREQLDIVLVELRKLHAHYQEDYNYDQGRSGSDDQGSR